MTDTPGIEAEIQQKLDVVLADEALIVTLNTNQHLAVALVLNRKYLLDAAGFTMLEAAERIGPKWLQAARKVERRYRAYLPLPEASSR